MAVVDTAWLMEVFAPVELAAAEGVFAGPVAGVAAALPDALRPVADALVEGVAGEDVAAGAGAVFAAGAVPPVEAAGAEQVAGVVAAGALVRTAGAPQFWAMDRVI
ncbi:hypothetical protein DB346_07335 [Verrucomicrobia bacterium LW23]|nr:hypothetical protein DB346_07335 [Verrucomicrobia bacterium LW23]